MLEDGNIKNWISYISKPNALLGGYAVCPYAKQAKYEVVETLGHDINPPPWDFDLIIYVCPDDFDEKLIIEIAKEYNVLFPDLVFLPDPKDRYTEINGVQTNNGEKNLILCQWRSHLEDARKKLLMTRYYQYWSDEYLQEILNT